MGRPETEFFRGSLIKITEMTSRYVDEMNMQNAAINNEHYESKYFKKDVETVSSLHDIKGLI